ncbi:Sua5/YciO/YrdC/YwlC family protein [Candidatus Woesearchaeota archaeon]|nr:Sua5/YciO/YrdC/YwlC family protein [Candidatus Woesearchaeota archaeon]
MRVVNKDEFRLEKTEFFDAILDGAIFIHATDTIYGLGCDATNKEAVARLRKIKEKDKQPFPIIAPNKEWIIENMDVKEKDLEKLPGPFTIIADIKNKDCIADNVNPLGNNTLGIRIPDHWFSMVVSMLGVPIVTTSVNKGGGAYMKQIEDLSSGSPSEIINLSKGKIYK